MTNIIVSDKSLVIWYKCNCLLSILLYAWVRLLPLSIHDEEVPFPKESSQNKLYNQSLWANNTISSSKRLIKKLESKKKDKNEASKE